MIRNLSTWTGPYALIPSWRLHCHPGLIHRLNAIPWYSPMVLDGECICISHIVKWWDWRPRSLSSKLPSAVFLRVPAKLYVIAEILGAIQPIWFVKLTIFNKSHFSIISYLAQETNLSILPAIWNCLNKVQTGFGALLSGMPEINLSFLLTRIIRTNNMFLLLMIWPNFSKQ